MTLSYALEITRERQCFDPRDKLYSVLSIVDGGDKYVVDYTVPPLELYSRIASFMRTTAVFPSFVTDVPASVGTLYYSMKLQIPEQPNENLLDVSESELLSMGKDVVKRFGICAFWARQMDRPRLYDSDGSGELDKADVNRDEFFCFVEQIADTHLLWTFESDRLSRSPSAYELTDSGSTWQEISYFAAFDADYAFGATTNQYQ